MSREEIRKQIEKEKCTNCKVKGVSGCVGCVMHDCISQLVNIRIEKLTEND